MRHYEKLSTEKYLLEAQQQESIDLRRQSNKEAFESFVAMACYLSVFAIAFFAWCQFPVWAEVIQNWF